MSKFILILVLMISVNVSAQDAASPAPTTPPAPEAAKPSEEKAEEVPAPKKEEKEWRVAVSGFYVSGGDAKFSDIKATTGGSTFNGDATYKTSPTFGIAVEGRKSKVNSWGLAVGMSYDAKRKVDSATITLGGTSSTGDLSPKPEISFLHVYLNALYKWENFYVLLGPNISSPNLSTSGGTVTYDVTGSIGLQLGVGYQFTDNIGAEITSRATSVRMKATTTTGTSYDFGTGFLGDALVAFKYTF